MDTVLRAMNISEGTIRHKVVLYNASPHFDFTAAANTQSIFLLSIPANTLIVGMLAKLVVQFYGVGVDSCAVTIGGIGWANPSVTSITSDNFYMPGFTCTQALSSTSFKYWSPVAMLTTDPQDIRANFTTTGTYLNAITAGEIELTITYRSL